MNHSKINQIKLHCLFQLEAEWTKTKKMVQRPQELIEPSGKGSVPVKKHPLEILIKKLTRIEKAQERIIQGEYGNCQLCGHSIWELLLAIPFAEFCIDCQVEVGQIKRRGNILFLAEDHKTIVQ